MTYTNMDLQESDSRTFLPPCRVCGDKAAGFHYGVNTCEACKGFFHRSLRRHKDYKCRANRTFGYCEYKPGKRKSCQFCRYQRCLHVGMSRDAIKTGRYTYLKRTEDTREIKRLLDIEQRQISSNSNDSHHHQMFPGSSLFTSSRPIASDLVEIEENEFDQHILDATDSVTEDTFSRFYGSEIVHDDINWLWSSDLLNFERKRKHTSHTKNNNSNSKRRRLDKHKPLSSQAIHKNHPVCPSGFDFSLTTHSPTVKQNSSNLLSNSDFRMSMDKESCLVRHNLLAVPDHRTQFKNSVIYRLLRDAETSRSEDRGGRNVEHKYDVTSRNQKLYPESGNKNFLETAFDLFPDISFCLSGQSTTTPCFFRSDDFDSSSVMESSGFSSSLSSQSVASSIHSPSLSPQLTITDLDNGMRFYVGKDEQTEADWCQTPEMSYPIEDGLFPHKTKDDDTLQIMEECTKGLDQIAEGPYDSRTPSPVQALMPTSLTPELKSDIDYTHKPTSAITHLSDAEIVSPSNISELYLNKNAVITMLMVSHKENIEDYSYMPKEEMLAQQKAHYEACLLKKQTFGDLGFLDEKEYDDIYSITGIDVDNRRLMMHKYLSRIEKQVRGLVQFAKSIPGFSYLDINIQTELIKLVRPEFTIFSMYPTVNLKLGITLGLTGEHWACDYELGTDGAQKFILDYMIFSDKLQKMAPTKEEEVLLKAILVVSTDRDNSVNSPLAEVIRWQLFQCLLHSLQKNREQPSLFLARYIMTLTQSRTVAESAKNYLRQLKLRKYSSIEKNPLLWEMYSWILLDKRDDESEQSEQDLGKEKVGLNFLWLLGCPLAL